MFAFVFMLIAGFFPLLFLLFRASYVLKHKERYSEERCFSLAKKIIHTCEFFSNTSPRFFELENLPPKETGYLLIANHQGKYDALAVISAMENPLGVLMETHQASKFGVRQVMGLLDGENIDLTRPRQQLRIIRRIGERVRDGAHFLVFPEGGYVDNHNSILNFHNGCLFSAYLARCPIVPVLLVDTYRSMNRNNIFAHVKPEVHFLPPIPYEAYKDLSREETTQMVRRILIQKMTERLAERGETYVPRDMDAPMPKAARKAYEAELRANAKKAGAKKDEKPQSERAPSRETATSEETPHEHTSEPPREDARKVNGG